MNNTLIGTDIGATQRLADPPYARQRYTFAVAVRQFRIVLLSQLASYRSIWFLQLFSGLLLPVALIFFVKSVAVGISQERAIFLLGGNMTMSIAFGPALFLIGKLGWARQSGEFEYWIAMPVPKLVLVLAIVVMALLFALPGIIGTYLLGSMLLGLSLAGGWTLALLIPLSVLPLAGLGAVLGSYAPNGQAANVMSNLMIATVGLFSPLMIRPELLPTPLRIIAWFMPTTYVADAFRAVLANRIDSQFGLDVLLLCLYAIVLLGLVHRKLEWRVE